MVLNTTVPPAKCSKGRGGDHSPDLGARSLEKDTDGNSRGNFRLLAERLLSAQVIRKRAFSVRLSTMRFLIWTRFPQGDSFQKICIRLFKFTLFSHLLYYFLYWILSLDYFQLYKWQGPELSSYEGLIKFHQRKYQYEMVILAPTWLLLSVTVIFVKVGLVNI